MIAVLRIGHRIDRDKRITTHIGLVARTFGADTLYIDAKDDRIKDTISSVCNRFGGSIKVITGISALKLVKQWDGIVVHLTMYGQPFEQIINMMDPTKDVLIVIGAEKVPRAYYEYADYNVAVGNQPHSEVAALALFLDRFSKGQWQNISFQGAMKIHPSQKGKHVESFSENAGDV